MANKAIEAYIKCPFYINESRNLLSCEGYVKNTCMTTRFPDAESKKAHIKENCFFEDGGRCPMARSLFAKYGMTTVKG